MTRPFDPGAGIVPMRELERKQMCAGAGFCDRSTPTALVTGKEDDVEKTEYIPSLLPNATVHLLERR